ncbi:CD4-1 molecule [Pempheris klunzingeri]|uniref:CD4-1 molecule n=1 Tax=Pempheris klunzingeri TaxID=3127111 RepID=UPI00397F6E8A
MKNLIQSILILIAVLKSTTGAEEVIYAQVGETVTLKAPVDNDFQSYLYWLYGKDISLGWRHPHGANNINADGHWTGHLSMSDHSLTIKNIQQEHFVTVLCKILNTPAPIATYRLLRVNVTMSPHSLLLPGDSLSLACTVETHQRKPQIYWLNPQGQKMNNRGLLTVRASGEYNGQWTCVVTNDKKEYKAKISVTVMDLSPPSPHHQYTSKSSPLTIPCSIPARISWEQIKAKGIQGIHWDFFPKPGLNPQRLFSLSLEDPLTWKPDQHRGLTPVQDLKGRNLSLTRNRGKEEDKGDYVCTLEFNNGLALNRTIHVKVLQIISTPGKELISGQQVNLTCGIGHSLPSDLQLKWIPPEQSSLSSLGPDHQHTHLTIPEVGMGDGGKWRCELRQNNTLLTSAVITLKIEKAKLSVWMLVIICSVTVIIILLILFFILYRRRKRKLTHLRHRLCQCKNPKPKGFYRT